MTPATQPVETLLLATDFSECAGFALAWAQRLADRHGAKLVIHHALAPPQGAPTMPELVPYPPELHEQYRKAAMDRLEKAAQAAREDGLKAIVDLQVGPAVSTILMVAEKHDADAIVTGTRGLSGLRHVLLGSTAERLVQHSPIPVLSVHPDMQPPEKISRILVPTDFSDDDHEPLHASLRLMADEDTEIVLLHAFHIPVEYTHLAGGFVMPDLARSALGEARDALERVAAPLRSEGHAITVAAREGYAPQAIEIEARERGVDLIAMGTHGRSFLPHMVLGSTAERVVQHAPCPVLTVRRSDG
ncbi:MAG: universal stress protein [Deltaproteobacteria bacterium]|nr:universal stress protein [Deltaproteobacteria bacterium]